MEREREFAYTPAEVARNLFLFTVYAPDITARELALEYNRDGLTPDEALRKFTEEASIEQFATIVAEENSIINKWDDIDLRYGLIYSAERYIFLQRLELSKDKLGKIRMTDDARKIAFDRIQPLEILKSQLVQTQRRSHTAGIEKSGY